jgi:hypothetical protein
MVNNRKEGDCEQADQTHIAGGDRHGGSFRRDGFSTAIAQERGPDWRLQRTLQRQPAVQRRVLLRTYQWSKPRILRFRSAITKSISQQSLGTKDNSRCGLTHICSGLGSGGDNLPLHLFCL